MNRNILKMLAVFLLIVTSMVYIAYTEYRNNLVEVEKITSRDDVPDKIWRALEEVDMQQGYYFFKHKFADTEELYFAICGGKDFQNGYNVKVLNASYDSWNDNPFDYPGYGGQFLIDISESESKEHLPYWDNIDAPLVVFKINRKHSEDDCLLLTSEGRPLNMNQWWGHEVLAGEGTFKFKPRMSHMTLSTNYSYSVVEYKSDVPTHIWEQINELDLERAHYLLENYLLVCGGEQYPDKYNFTFDKVVLREPYEGYSWSGNEYSNPLPYLWRFGIHEYNDYRYSYSEGYEYPFVIVQLQSDNSSDYLIKGIFAFANEYKRGASIPLYSKTYLDTLENTRNNNFGGRHFSGFLMIIACYKQYKQAS